MHTSHVKTTSTVILIMALVPIDVASGIFWHTLFESGERLSWSWSVEVEKGKPSDQLWEKGRSGTFICSTCVCICSLLYTCMMY